MWRDAGDWDRFATVWHDDGWMTATWFQGPARDFIAVSREGFDKGVSILHFLGGFTCDVERQSRHLPGEDDDQPARRGRTRCWWTWCASAASTTSWKSAAAAGASCAGSRFTRRTGWTRSTLRRACRWTQRELASFPEGYRHLAYLQSSIGFKVKGNLPGLRGAAVEKLYGEGAAWLAGSATPGAPL